MNKKYLGIIALVVIVVIVGFAAGRSEKNSKDGQPSVVFSKPVVIELSLRNPSLPNDDGTEIDRQNGAKLAVEEINKNGGIHGQPIKLTTKQTANAEFSFKLVDSLDLAIYPDTDVEALSKMNLKGNVFSLAPSKQLQEEFLANYLKTYKGADYASLKAVVKRPSPEFVASYRETYKQDPNFAAASAYDAVYILARADAEQPKDIGHYMRSTNFKTVNYGNITFDDKGAVNTPGNYFEIKK